MVTRVGFGSLSPLGVSGVKALNNNRNNSHNNDNLKNANQNTIRMLTRIVLASASCTSRREFEGSRISVVSISVHLMGGSWSSYSAPAEIETQWHQGSTKK